MGFQGSLTWVGHSTFLVDAGPGSRVLFEAFVDSCPTTPPRLQGDGLGDVDLMLVSHGHGDHVADAVQIQQRTDATVAGMVELMGWLGAQGVPAQRRIDFNKGGTIEHAGVRVTMTHAMHSASTPDGTYAGEPAGFVVELPDGFRIYHAGDTALFGDMTLIRELHQPDLALLPIGDHYTMDPRAAATAARLLGVRHVIGMHYGTFPPLVGRPAHLREHLAGSDVRVHELTPGDRLDGATFDG